MDKENKLILYKDGEGKVSVNTRFADEDVWLTQEQLATIYQTTQENVSMHITNIYTDNELDKEGTYKKFLLVRQEGKRQVRRNIDHYNLDVIIALGYRVQSPIAVRFRRWATLRLHEYIQKGFTMDDERLKQGGNRYFRELLQRIRDIRSSERNFYQQVTDIYATSIDYDPRAKMTKLFFATVQNKMHYAVHGRTAAELIMERADADKEHMGLTTWENAPDGKIVKTDVTIAKNYLKEMELEDMGRIVTAVLEFAESRAKRHIPMTMEDWAKRIDAYLSSDERPILDNAGSVSHEDAVLHAETEFEKYRIVQDRLFRSDFDRFLGALPLEEDNTDDK